MCAQGLNNQAPGNQAPGSGDQPAELAEELKTLLGEIGRSSPLPSVKLDSWSRREIAVLLSLGVIFVGGSVLWLKNWAPHAQNTEWYIYSAFLALILTGALLIITAVLVLCTGLRAAAMERKMIREDRRWAASMYMRLVMSPVSVDGDEAAGDNATGS